MLGTALLVGAAMLAVKIYKKKKAKKLLASIFDKDIPLSETPSSDALNAPAEKLEKQKKPKEMKKESSESETTMIIEKRDHMEANTAAGNFRVDF